MRLSASQQAAVAHQEGPALVLAVPGSGKTTVLLRRARHLLDQGVKAERVLAVTFSRTQALDMRLRDLRTQQTGVSFQTIHQFCYGLVKEEADRTRRTFRVIETEPFHKRALLRKIGWRLFGRPLSSSQTDAFFHAYGRLVNTMQTPESVLGSAECTLIRAYEEEKKKWSYLDFDDMLTRAFSLMEEDDRRLRRWRRRYSHVLLDEGQDTSRLQWEILRRLAAPEHNLFVVADDDQSIYRFRGAEPELLRQFSEGEPKPAIYRLEENYRSRSEVLAPADRLIDHNRARFHKTLRPARGGDGSVSFRVVKDMAEETRRIVRALKALPAERTAAVLYRNRLSGVPVGMALRDAGIDFDWQSPPEAFFRHPIREDVNDFFRAAHAPTDVALCCRVLRKTNVFVSEETFARWERSSPGNVWRALLQDETAAAAEIGRRKRLVRQMESLPHRSFAEGVNRIVHEMGYGIWLREWARRQEGLNAEAVLDVLATGAAYVRKWEDWMDVWEERPRPATRRIVLSTIHGAKGLEFDEVIMMDLMQHEFPGDRESECLESLEEERRLFYVGMTRAKEKLTLLSLKQRSGLPCEPSQFIRESGLCR